VLGDCSQMDPSKILRRYELAVGGREQLMSKIDPGCGRWRSYPGRFINYRDDSDSTSQQNQNEQIMDWGD
jgi:hypothetical protein